MSGSFTFTPTFGTWADTIITFTLTGGLVSSEINGYALLPFGDPITPQVGANGAFTVVDTTTITIALNTSYAYPGINAFWLNVGANRDWVSGTTTQFNQITPYDVATTPSTVYLNRNFSITSTCGGQGQLASFTGVTQYAVDYDVNAAKVLSSSGLTVNNTTLTITGLNITTLATYYLYLFNEAGDPVGSVNGEADRFNLARFPVSEAPPCFKEDSKILTDKGYVTVQNLKKGDLVKTSKNGFKPIALLGKSKLEHHANEDRIVNQLYKLSKKQYPDLFEDLVLTGAHAVLVDSFDGEQQKEATVEVLGRVFVTDSKYRLPACVDKKSTVYEETGLHTIYHLALENDNYYGNYGIYANGLLVESCSKRFLKEISGMTLIE